MWTANGAVRSAYRPPQATSLHLQVTIILIAAYAQAAGVSWPFSFLFGTGQSLWWMQCLALGALVGVLHVCPTWRRATGLGLLFAIAWLCATFWWLYISMHTYAGLNSLLTALAIASLAAALGLYYAAA